ncbi:MAG: hypothetical protein U5K79_03505 [Cyclobacteriaceae bacterium]|nr:hypothetical protein [Cyclobacteriaceae bacterium]
MYSVVHCLIVHEPKDRFTPRSDLIDSLTKEANRNTENQRVEFLIKLYWEYRGVDNQKADSLSEIAL